MKRSVKMNYNSDEINNTINTDFICDDLPDEIIEYQSVSDPVEKVKMNIENIKKQKNN